MFQSRHRHLTAVAGAALIPIRSFSQSGTARPWVAFPRAGDLLYNRLLARDEQALVELVDLATPWLLGVAYGMLSDRDEAEEVVQGSLQHRVAPGGSVRRRRRRVDGLDPPHHEKPGHRPAKAAEASGREDRALPRVWRGG